MVVIVMLWIRGRGLGHAGKGGGGWEREQGKERASWKESGAREGCVRRESWSGEDGIGRVMNTEARGEL